MWWCCWKRKCCWKKTCRNEMKQSYDIKPAPRCMYSEIGTRCTRLSCIKRWRSSKSCMFSIAAANTFFQFFAPASRSGDGSGCACLWRERQRCLRPWGPLRRWHRCSPCFKAEPQLQTKRGLHRSRWRSLRLGPKTAGIFILCLQRMFWDENLGGKVLEARYYILFLFDHRGWVFYFCICFATLVIPETSSNGFYWLDFVPHTHRFS